MSKPQWKCQTQKQMAGYCVRVFIVVLFHGNVGLLGGDRHHKRLYSIMVEALLGSFSIFHIFRIFSILNCIDREY